MSSKRKYKIKGTNDFLVFAGICFFLCIWAVKDAWYPSEKVLKKHPLEVVEAFETAGSIEKLYGNVGDMIPEGFEIGRLRTEQLEKDLAAEKKTYSEAKKQQALMVQSEKNAVNNGASDAGIEEIRAGLEAATQEMADSLEKVNELRATQEASVLVSSIRGEIKELKVAQHTLVEAGDAVMVLDPQDHFYLFNKSLAIFTFLAFWPLLLVHIFGR